MPFYFYYWPFWMEYWWLYQSNAAYATEYAREQGIEQGEILELEAQAEALKSAPVQVDPAILDEYIRLIADQNTPDNVIEAFFQKNHLTDDQIIAMQAAAVKKMEMEKKADGNCNDVVDEDECGDADEDEC
jgi:hypothetical protein